MFYKNLSELTKLSFLGYYQNSRSSIKKQDVFGANDHRNVSLLRQRIYPRLNRVQALTVALDFLHQHKDAATQYSNLLNKAAQETFGRDFLPTDYRISGIGSEEFSAERKDQIRETLQIMNKTSHMSLLWQRYAGVRITTISIKLLEDKLAKLRK